MSQIPVFLLALVTPWYFIRSVADLGANVALDYNLATNLRASYILREITYSLFSVPVFVGLVLCAWNSEFSSIVSHAGPMHLEKPNFQNPQPQGPVYFNDQPSQPMQPLTIPNSTPYAGSHQSWHSNSTSTPVTHGNGVQQYPPPPHQQYSPPPHQQHPPPPHQQHQQYPNANASNGGFYAPQSYPQQHYSPPPQQGSPPPQQPQYQPYVGGPAELGQYRALSPQSYQSGGNVSPVNSSPGQAYAVPGQGPTPPHDTNPGVIR